ncbi:MAG TPA: ribonuclease J [Caldisericia bacterium]|nr:ribonuclease J [Caldisericia bacterium]HPF49134.1 ribonuclease J [Caldisericia bacterium]HPI83002.1 ribonuclease J [Caldisericia bacterium]HPQ92229.1 ribonuclease J [Caldisericia bacterium]HRV74673.1 ribonuclease J [Caldisericia bacterium]
MRQKDSNVYITLLGGLGEIGKNMSVVEWGNSAVMIDAGFKFPDADLPGVDKVIPDLSYVESIKHKLKAILLTHGHADHIGALRYVLETVKVPVYGTELTLGLADEVLPGSVKPVEFMPVKFNKSFTIAGVKTDFIRVNHSIPEGSAIALHLPAGIVLHTGDFKIDMNPIDGHKMDLQRFGELGLQGVLCMLADSTNADEPGYTGSESEVGKTLDRIFRAAPSRIVVATFSTNIHRLQQVVDATARFGKRLLIDGRGIIETIKVAGRLGHFNLPDNLTIKPEQIKSVKPENLVILTTGTQGEPMSGLTKLASSTHKNISIRQDDTVLISADPIPGNETLVSRTVSGLLKFGANVFYRSIDAVHVSGHASQEELKILLGLVKPKYFVPVHGEYKQLWFHSKIAQELGTPKENVFLCENGDQLKLSNGAGKIHKKVPASAVYIDGSTVGDIGTVVLKERSRLSRDGFMTISIAISRLTKEVLAGPDINSQGFIYMKESSDTIDKVKKSVLNTAKEWKESKTSIPELKKQIKQRTSEVLLNNTRRRPVILPVVLQV